LRLRRCPVAIPVRAAAFAAVGSGPGSFGATSRTAAGVVSLIRVAQAKQVTTPGRLGTSWCPGQSA
jgi:hypothetical protein